MTPPASTSPDPSRRSATPAVPSAGPDDGTADGPAGGRTRTILNVRVLLPAAEAGIAAGVGAFLVGRLWPRPEGDEFTGMAVTFLAFFPLGLPLGRALGLPRWQLVGVLAPFVAVPLLAGVADALWVVRGIGFTLPVVPVAAAAAFVLAAWLCAPGSRVARACVGVAFLLASAFTPSVAYARYGSPLEEAIRTSGVPLVAPVVPGYELAGMDERYLPGAIALYYTRPGASLAPALHVHVASATATTPREACAAPSPDWSREAVEPCREAEPGVWTTRLANGYASAFARHGDALVQVGGFDVPQALLLSALRVVRPVAPAELVMLHRT